MQRRQFTLVLAIVIALAIAGIWIGTAVVLRDHDGQTAAPSRTSVSPGSSQQPAAAPAPTHLSPLTGEPAPSSQPVLAVKIDNASAARPQTGLPEADVVYVEPVEGGLSRIMAIFSSTIPDRVGPVRSARLSDLEILGQYGRPALAFSGANRPTLTAIASAPVVDLPQQKQPDAYQRSSAKAAPHNLFADPAALLRRADGVGTARDIGLRFGVLPAGLGRRVTHETVRYSAASSTFTWSAKREQWLISFDRRPAMSSSGSRLSASTVVIQYTQITASGLHDVLGNPTPFTVTVGAGSALVLRDGYAIPARWSRPVQAAGTRFTTTAGATLPFAAGQVWVVYAQK
jgi:hypothetical protein